MIWREMEIGVAVAVAVRWFGQPVALVIDFFRFCRKRKTSHVLTFLTLCCLIVVICTINRDMI